MKREVILIVDFGTSKVHSNLIDINNGSNIYGESAGIKWLHPTDSWTEIDPDEIWEVSQRTVEKILRIAGKNIKILGISFSYMGDNLIPVDKNGNKLYNLIPAFDNRSINEINELANKIGGKKYLEITGSIVSPMNVGSKILWLRNNLRGIFDKTKYFFSLQQFINSKLGLEAINDYTMSSRKMLYNNRDRKWSKAIIEVIGISEDSLGNIVTESTTVIGKINKYGRVKLPYEIPVIIGAHDCECGLIGLGISSKKIDKLGNITGTFDHIAFFTKNIINIDYKSNLYNLYAYCGPLKDNYVIMGNVIAGSSLEWFTKNLYKQEDKDVFSRLDNLVKFDGSSRLFFIPGLEISKGCLIGIDLSHKLIDIYRSIIEGLTYNLKSVIDKIEATVGINFKIIRSGGGTSISDKWLQLKADLLNKQIERVKNLEISSVGAAIIACIGMGIFKNFDEAFYKMVSVDKVFKPNKILSKKYKEKFNNFNDLSINI
jgi:xylulokinase